MQANQGKEGKKKKEEEEEEEEDEEEEAEGKKWFDISGETSDAISETCRNYAIKCFTPNPRATFHIYQINPLSPSSFSHPTHTRTHKKMNKQPPTTNRKSKPPSN